MDVPAAVVLDGVVAFAEGREVVEGGGAAVFPGKSVVDVAAGGWGVAAGGHAVVGAPLDEFSEGGWGPVVVASGGEDGAGFGVGEDAHPVPVAPAELSCLDDGDGSDSFDGGKVRQPAGWGWGPVAG